MSAPPRHGGDLVTETLAALGADTVFGLPGVHALANFEGLRRSPLTFVGARTELAAAFAADGFARATGRPAPLFLSTGPGTLISTAGLMEAASSYDPVVAIATQISSDQIGRGRGALHEHPDQLSSVAPLVKYAERVRSTASIPELIGEAWRAACASPTGPVFLEIPVDLLEAETNRPPPTDLHVAVPTPADPDADSLQRARAWLNGCRRPAVLVGSGTIRANATAQLLSFAERLDAPVLASYMGKGAFPEDHPLYVGSACEERGWQEVIESADLVVCIGSELGSETTGQYRLRPPSRLIQIDVSPLRIGATFAALGLVGDAARVLDLLTDHVERRPTGGRRRAADARAVLAQSFSDRPEAELLRAIRIAWPDSAPHAWDMTILGYWAASAFDAKGPRHFIYPLGSGTLGFAFPAALGAAVGTQQPALAVMGDGGAMYALSELAAAVQHRIAATWLIIDDGGYGILREYQRASYGHEFAVDLTRPDFLSLARAFGVNASDTSRSTLTEDLSDSLKNPGPTVLVLRDLLESPPAFE